MTQKMFAFILLGRICEPLNIIKLSTGSPSMKREAQDAKIRSTGSLRPRRWRFWRFREFLWLAGGRWRRHAYQQPCLSARVSKMNRNWGHVLCEIAQRRLENRFGVIADAPGRALTGLFYLPGYGTGIVGYRALKRSADNALLID